MRSGMCISGKRCGCARIWPNKSTETVMELKNICIAVDGPAGAGKSSVSKACAKAFGLVYIDTGAMYRSAALYAIEQGIPITEDALAPELDNIQIDMRYTDGVQRIYLNGKDVTARIREADVSRGASDIAVIPAVRLKLVELQRMLAKNNPVIMDGRDIGTYVLPDADLKIFLTTSVDVRARRRLAEMAQKGEAADFETVKRDIQYRDKNDSEREFAPLRQAVDAVLVDSSNMDFDGVVAHISNLIQGKLGAE